MGQNVLRAVTFNGVQLLMTALLALIILYFFAVLEFLLLRTNFFLDDFSDLRACDTLMDCFLVTVREGLINGGGMADCLEGNGYAKNPEKKSPFMARLFFDLAFFITIIIILDTFSAMREMTESKINDMKTVCFICSIDKPT